MRNIGARVPDTAIAAIQAEEVEEIVVEVDPLPILSPDLIELEVGELEDGELDMVEELLEEMHNESFG